MCESCRARARVARVVLRSNIGFVVQRRTVELDAKLCRRCIRGYFWQFTLSTLGLGWWGAYSFLFTLYALPANVAWLIRTWHLPPGPIGPVRIDHYTTLGWLYGTLFTGFGGICAIIAASSTDVAERHQMALGASLLILGLAVLVASLIRRGSAPVTPT